MPSQDHGALFRTIAVRNRDGARLIIVQTREEAHHAVATLPQKGWKVRVELMRRGRPR